MYNIDPSIVQEYAKKYNISHEDALKKLRENYEKEVSKIDNRQLSLRCMRGLREVSPKVAGLEQRQNDLLDRTITLENFVNLHSRQISEVHDLLKILKPALDNLINKEPWYIRLWNKVKCLIKKN